MHPDLSSTLQGLQQGRLQALDLMQQNLSLAQAPACRHAFVRLFEAGALAAARATDLQAQAGLPRARLGGIAISIKDLFDVAGWPSTGGSRAMDDAQPARSDSAAVARLRAAGAAPIGHTNLSEFAFSGVGINPHHGTPPNPVTLALDGLQRIPGGSTSGGAVSVASGAAWAALGSDTGGSIRIPAALQGLVGFKNTARLTPAEGCIPLSTSLDTVCALTRSVRDAVLMHEVLAQRTVRLARRPLNACRFGVPNQLLEGMDATVSRAFERCLAALSRAGARVESLCLPELDDLAPLQAGGGLPAAESWAWHRERIASHGPHYDPRVALRIRRGAAISAADYLQLLSVRRAWISRMETALQGFDAMLSPTVPVVAPLLQPLLDSDETFFACNTLLLRNTSVVNLLDGCALSLPCQQADELPVGLMAWAPALHDDHLLDLSLSIEAALQAPLEA